MPTIDHVSYETPASASVSRSRQQRPTAIALPTVQDGQELDGYASSLSSGVSTMYLLTPNAVEEPLSATPSPLSSPADGPYRQPHTQMASVFNPELYHTPAQPGYAFPPPTTTYPMAPRQPNLLRRASIAVDPSYRYPSSSSSRKASTSSASGSSKPAVPLSVQEQEALPSWRRDFDKISDAQTKTRWGKELYADFQAGRIPMTGRVAQDIIDWTTCVAKVGGEIDAEATAKLLVAAQERKAELQTSAMKLKSALADKEPPRRQNKFICYRSLRSSQLASHFTSFKQSQFSAITSLEWKEVDTDWWGEVANRVEDVRRAKYNGQLDTKGNPLRRGSIDSQAETASHTPKLRKTKSSAKLSRTPLSRFDPYSTPLMRPTASRMVSYQAASLSPPVPAVHRHSIDMGVVSGMQYSGSDESALGLYQPEAPAPLSFPTLTAIPQSPVTYMPSASTYTPAPAPPADHSYFSEPFPYSAHLSPTTPFGAVPYSSPPSHLRTPFTTTPLYPNPPYYPQSYDLPPAQPHVYVAQPWTPHGRGGTNELMEMYTVAQDYVPVEGHHASAQAPCCMAAPGEWSSHYPGAHAR